MEQCVVIIPVHSSHPSHYELIAFQQCFKILAKHPIKVIAPKKLDLQAYKEKIPGLEVRYIDPKWQSSFFNYNKLKRSRFFYRLFKGYKYLLTYELDAFVFRDELSEWCNRSFDYIGAPWFKGWNLPDADNEIIGVGNSGFSLRNVQSSLNLLKRVAVLKPLRMFWFKSRIQSVIRFSTVLTFLKGIYKIDNYDSLNWALTENDLLEDFFWSQVISKAFSDYKVAGISDAIKFSFEVNPSYLFCLNKEQLPFGCHAWDKHEPGFWKQYITC